VDYTHTHTYPFNGPFSGTTQVSRYQKGKTNLNSSEVRDSEWQWRQLGHMEVCTLLQTDNHANTSPLSFLQAGCPSCSGVSWAICKYAPCSRQITTPTPHHSVFYRPDALPVAQPTASKHWRDYTEPKLVCGIVIRFRWSWQGFCWGTTQHHQLNSYDYHGHDSNIRQPVCNVQTSSKLLVHLIETQCVRSHYLLDTGIMV